MPDKGLKSAHDDAEDFDKEADFNYMPSNWSCKSRLEKSSSAVLTDYVTQCQKGATAVYRDFANSVTTIEYGDRVYEKIDIVHPLPSDYGAISGDTLHKCSVPADDTSRKCSVPADDTPHKCAMLAYFHGGYWQEGNYKVGSMHPAPSIVQGGHYYAAVGYLDEAQLSLSEITEQAVAAVNRLANYASEYNISCIILSGHSAGAHLVAMAILSPKLNENAKSLIKGVVLLSGVYDIQPLINTSANIPELSISSLLVAKQLSPMLLLGTEQVVVKDLKHNLISYGEAESTAFKTQSNDFYRLMTKLGIPATVSESTGKDHFNLVSDLMKPEDPLNKAILALLDESCL